MERYNTTLQYLQAIHETLVEPVIEIPQEESTDAGEPNAQSLEEEPVTEDEEVSSAE